MENKTTSADLKKMCEEYFENSVNDQDDDDLEHYILEAAMELTFGMSVWNDIIVERKKRQIAEKKAEIERLHKEIKE